jgi:hypothetical protein
MQVFDEDVIRPEKQDMQIFAEGMKTITDTNARVANMYLEVLLLRTRLRTYPDAIWYYPVIIRTRFGIIRL